MVLPTFKQAQHTPILKKANLDKYLLSNYRPISNLLYVSKLLDCIAASQLISYLEANNLANPFQSEYKRHHSTGTALTFVSSDLLYVT